METAGIGASIATCLYKTHDVPTLLCHLIHRQPWTRISDKGDVQIFNCEWILYLNRWCCLSQVGAVSKCIEAPYNQTMAKPKRMNFTIQWVPLSLRYSGSYTPVLNVTQTVFLLDWRPAGLRHLLSCRNFREEPFILPGIVGTSRSPNSRRLPSFPPAGSH